MCVLPGEVLGSFLVHEGTSGTKEPQNESLCEEV